MQGQRISDHCRTGGDIRQADHPDAGDACASCTAGNDPGVFIMKKSIFLGKWFLCVLGAAVLAGSAGFTAGAAGTEGLETGWEKEQEI